MEPHLKRNKNFFAAKATLLHFRRDA